MAPILPSVVPGCIVAGDSASWQRAFQDYPASDGWTLAYTVVGPDKVYNFTATADGDAFNVNLAPTDTAGWVAGTYRLVEAVSKTSQRITLNITTLAIQPNLADADAGVDTRTHSEKMLAAIDAWLELRAPTAASVEINGRKIQYYDIAELVKLRSQFALQVKREQTAPGDVAGTRILVRF